MTSISAQRNRFGRRAIGTVMTAVSSTVLIGFVALAVDMGMLYNVRVELQRSADAGALAGGWNLLGDERLQGSAGLTTVFNETRTNAVNLAERNQVFGSNPDVDPNAANAPSGDVVLGYLSNPDDLSESLCTDVGPSSFNAVSVLVRRDSVRNGPIPLLFAQLIGFGSRPVTARGVAAIKDGAVVGYKVTPQSGNADLLPLALHINSWNGLIAGTTTNGDNFAYNPDTGVVSAGSDGVLELNIYPGAGSGQLPPGNFGTVDIGNPNNSTADLSRQIRYGVNAADLAYLGGEVKFGPDGVLPLNGDTGLSAGIKDDLAAIIGKPRAIPVFNQVAGPGNNAVYSVIRFAGIRIMDVKLTGPMSGKRVIVQPAVVVDDAAIAQNGADKSTYVYQPPRLVR